MTRMLHRVHALLPLLLPPRRREQYLVRYVLREHGKGRPLDDVLDDPYVRNRSAPEERARLLERPEVVAEIGEQALSELRPRLTRKS